MHSHTYTHVHQSALKKKSLAITPRSSPWPSPTLTGIPAGLADLEASSGKTKAIATQISIC